MGSSKLPVGIVSIHHHNKGLLNASIVMSFVDHFFLTVITAEIGTLLLILRHCWPLTFFNSGIWDRYELTIPMKLFVLFTAHATFGMHLTNAAFLDNASTDATIVLFKTATSLPTESLNPLDRSVLQDCKPKCDTQCWDRTLAMHEEECECLSDSQDVISLRLDDSFCNRPQ